MEITLYFQEMWQLTIEGKAQGIFFWFSVYMLIVCIYSLVLQIRMRFWPSTHGELVKLELDRFGASITKSDQDYKANAFIVTPCRA